MPIGHLVDLLWRWKGWLVGLGAGLLATSLGIMAALIGGREAMSAILTAEVWYVLSTLLGPIGYVVQDAVADAMTVDAVPRVDERGQPFDQPTLKLMHTTMQTLGALQPSFTQMGEMAGFDAVAVQRYPEIESINHVHTPGNSSGIVDGAAAILIGSKKASKDAG